VQKLCSWEVNAPTHDFEFDKTIHVSSSTFMFRVHPRKMNGVGPFHDCVPQCDISYDLLSYPNYDCMKTLHFGKVNVPTYHF
jgi:hypothetical protein